MISDDANPPAFSLNTDGFLVFWHDCDIDAYK